MDEVRFELIPWKQKTWRQEIPFVDAVKSLRSNKPLITLNIHGEIESLLDGNIATFCHAGIWAFGNEYSTGNFVPRGQPVPNSVPDTRAVFEPGWDAQITCAFDTRSDESLFDMAKEIDGHVTNTIGFNIRKVPRRPFQDGSQRRRWYWQTPLFYPRTIANTNWKVPASVHPWIRDAAAVSQDWIPNPVTPRMLHYTDTEFLPIQQADPPMFQAGDIVWVSFTLQYVVTDKHCVPRDQEHSSKTIKKPRKRIAPGRAPTDRETVMPARSLRTDANDTGCMTPSSVSHTKQPEYRKDIPAPKDFSLDDESRHQAKHTAANRNTASSTRRGIIQAALELRGELDVELSQQPSVMVEKTAMVSDNRGGTTIDEPDAATAYAHRYDEEFWINVPIPDVPDELLESGPRQNAGTADIQAILDSGLQPRVHTGQCSTSSDSRGQDGADRISIHASANNDVSVISSNKDPEDNIVSERLKRPITRQHRPVIHTSHGVYFARGDLEHQRTPPAKQNHEASSHSTGGQDTEFTPATERSVPTKEEASELEYADEVIPTEDIYNGDPNAIAPSLGPMTYLADLVRSVGDLKQLSGKSEPNTSRSAKSKKRKRPTRITRKLPSTYTNTC
ncbi:hypothetical protein OE88DRAFT_1640801 [Heliocybe sulcata]|uniref:Uncharacterized protein n=1 Tax=Heliocybe sulcata TaxID=5364 RepID=A0A5C3NGZ5_9AGAM|nr:hypothetical protein OE88DRAFT_1640801 [Heliocybe sulcata]